MNPENTNPTRRSRNPSCTLCGNHGVRSELKNHKHKCPYNSCECRLCDRGRERREVMRKQVRLRRQQMKQIYSKGYTKNKRGNFALGVKDNPSKTTANSPVFSASSNINIVQSGRRNLGNFETVLVNSEAVPATTSSINHQSSQTTPNGSPYYEYSRFPTHAVSVYPQNNESFAYYLNLSPPGISTPPQGQSQSPRQCVSPLLGKLSTSENSAFVKFSPGQSRMVFEDGMSLTDGWPCEIRDSSNEAALALASLQHKNI